MSRRRRRRQQRRPYSSTGPLAWLRAGMPLAETARRLGNSFETLVSTYVGALDDEEHVGNQRIDTILG